MSGRADRIRFLDPMPSPRLKREDFVRISENGFGDGWNSYPHSMAWFHNKLYVGTTRANLCMMKAFRDAKYSFISEPWPIECPDDIYDLDRRAHVWRYDPQTLNWEQVFRSPMVVGDGGLKIAREFGYRNMVVFQGLSDEEPALYLANWAPGKAPGSLILRSADGVSFEPVSEYGVLGLKITTVRALVSFKDRLFFSPAGTRGGNACVSGVPVIFASRDPRRCIWEPVNEPGFGDSGNQTIYEMRAFGDQLYAGTFNSNGFQLWRSACEGKPPYEWIKVLERGAYRGALNQIIASMHEFKGALYIGTAIQGGGYDAANKIGPAPAELLRVYPDDKWEILIGNARETPHGKKYPVSGLTAGMGNFFNGYFWSLGSHDGWLYLGTYDSSGMLPWVSSGGPNSAGKRVLEKVGIKNVISYQGGFELWCSYDGENWLPVHRRGFDNPFNWGVRNMVDSDYGLFVGVANGFGPRIAVQRGGHWVYVDNPRGGLEMWLGTKDKDRYRSVAAGHPSNAPSPPEIFSDSSVRARSE